MSIGLIITSAGQSARFGKDTHKILANIHRTPLIMHTIMAFATFDEITECVITVPEELCETINTITKNVGAKFKILVISGGKTRFESVAKAVNKIKMPHTNLMVHDGARPNPSKELIRNIIETGLNFPAVIPGIPVVDTIKEINSKGNVETTPERNILRAIQTPQIFKLSALKYSTENVSDTSYTDEASRLEALGFPIKVINGDRHNIKVTYPEDIINIAQFMKSHHQYSTLKS